MLFEIRINFRKIMFSYLYINFRPQGRVLQNSFALFSQFISQFFFDTRLFYFLPWFKSLKLPTFFQLAVSLCFCDLFSIDSLQFRARKNVSTFLFFGSVRAGRRGRSPELAPLAPHSSLNPYAKWEYGAYENRYEMKAVFLISSFVFKLIYLLK